MESSTHSTIDRSQSEVLVSQNKWNARQIVLILVSLFIVGAIVFAFWPKSNTAQKKEKSVPVTVATATSSAVPIEIRSIGNVTPYSVVNITPQVSGQLLKVCFVQGASVHKGDFAFSNRSLSIRSSVAQAEGNVAKDKAQITAAIANVAKDIAQVGQLKT